MDITIPSTALQFYAQARKAIIEGTLAIGYRVAGDPWGDYRKGTLPWSRNFDSVTIWKDLPSKFKQEPHIDDIWRMVNACVLGAST